MKDVPRTDESPEQDVIGPPESKIVTFDELKSADNQEGLETFNDLKTTGQTDRIQAVKNLDKPQQNIEQDRLDHAAIKIEKADWLQQKNGKLLVQTKKE